MDRAEGVAPDTLDGLSLTQLWQMFPIVLAGYNPDYQLWFAEEAQALVGLFPGSVHRINHIGSTAVPDLVSKPTIDILLELLPACPGGQIVDKLTAAGWSLMACSDEPLRIDLNKGYTPAGFAERVYHLHVVHPGDHDELYFRDYLLNHPDVRDEYAALKRELFTRYEHDRDAYTDGKTTFVRAATWAARREFPGRYSHDELPQSQTF